MSQNMIPSSTLGGGNMPTAMSKPIFGNPKFGDLYVSFTPDSKAAQVRLYNAVNSSENRLSEMVDKTLNIVDVIVKKVALADRTDKGWTAEDASREGFRTILIDGDGNAYTATSNGVYSSVMTMLSIFGTLHFEEPLTVEVKEVRATRGKTLTLKLME